MISGVESPEQQLFNWGTINANTNNRTYRPNRSSAIKSAVSAMKQGSTDVSVVRKIDNKWKIDAKATEEAISIVDSLPEKGPIEAKTSLRLLSTASRALAVKNEYSKEDIHAFIECVKRCFDALDVSSDDMDLLVEENE